MDEPNSKSTHLGEDLTQSLETFDAEHINQCTESGIRALFF